MSESDNKANPPDNPRQDWAEKFAEMHRNGDDKLVIEDVFEDESFEG